MEDTVKTLDHLELSILVFSTAGALVVKQVYGVYSQQYVLELKSRSFEKWFKVI